MFGSLPLCSANVCSRDRLMVILPGYTPSSYYFFNYITITDILIYTIRWPLLFLLTHKYHWTWWPVTLRSFSFFFVVDFFFHLFLLLLYLQEYCIWPIISKYLFFFKICISTVFYNLVNSKWSFQTKKKQQNELLWLQTYPSRWVTKFDWWKVSKSCKKKLNIWIQKKTSLHLKNIKRATF